MLPKANLVQAVGHDQRLLLGQHRRLSRLSTLVVAAAIQPLAAAAAAALPLRAPKPARGWHEPRI